MQSRSLFNRTISNGGGTFEMHADNFNRQDIKSGYTVGLVEGTFAYSPTDNKRIFNYGIARAIEKHPEADAIGTWVNGDRIHIDPVRIFQDFDSALKFAREKKQIAFFHLDTFTEYTVADYDEKGQ